MLKGTLLHPDDRRHVLDAYIYRMTTEARKRWPDVARRMLQGGYRMPELTDAEWLDCTFFGVRKDARLDRRVRHCHCER